MAPPGSVSYLLRNEVACHGKTAPAVVTRRPQVCDRAGIDIDAGLQRHPADSALIDNDREEVFIPLPTKDKSEVEVVLRDSRRKSSAEC